MAITIFILFCFSIFQQPLSGDMQQHKYNYLALGDSYTIGEAVSPSENFPNQLTTILTDHGYLFSPPEIIATTGWTSSELQTAITKKIPARTNFDIVTLSIGVNNQYRGESTEKYAIEFEALLVQAIGFAAQRPLHVFVLSIPDWSATPYAEGRDRGVISKQIDQFNEINKRIALKLKVNYIDITAGTREAITQPSLVAGDGLHPSGKEYRRWAEQLFSVIQQYLK